MKCLRPTISATLVAILVFPVLSLAQPSPRANDRPAGEAAPDGARPDEPRPGAAQAMATQPDEGQDPDNEQFAKLVEAGKRYRSIAESGGWPALPDGEPMKPGQQYDCARIEALRQRLEVEGYGASTGTSTATRATQGAKASTTGKPAARNTAASKSGRPGDAATGGKCTYGRDLAAAVEQFQEDRYLAKDGVVGGRTQTQLAKPVEDVLAKIDYAIKRWRANSASMTGSYVVVNIPAFELGVYDGPNEVMRMPVIVGMSDWQTPEMSDKIDSVVINPSWNIPKSIADEEVLPKSKKDRGYLRRQGIVAREGGTLTQKPGPKNPLGRLKFMMPNREDIYLHDTPNKQKFGAPVRAFSHGCVRVEKPVDLAGFLLEGDAKWSKERIAQAIASKQTQTVKLDRPVAVHLLYIPAVVTDEGRLRVAPDVYDKLGNGADEAATQPAPTEEGEFLGAYP